MNHGYGTHMGYSQGFGGPFPSMNYYPQYPPQHYPQQHQQHPSYPVANSNSQFDSMKGMPQRKIEFACIFTKNDPTAKQKRIQISQFPCTISGFVQKKTYLFTQI